MQHCQACSYTATHKLALRYRHRLLQVSTKIVQLAAGGRPDVVQLASMPWMGALDIDTSNDHLRRPPAA